MAAVAAVTRAGAGSRVAMAAAEAAVSTAVAVAVSAADLGAASVAAASAVTVGDTVATGVDSGAATTAVILTTDQVFILDSVATLTLTATRLTGTRTIPTLTGPIRMLTVAVPTLHRRRNKIMVISKVTRRSNKVKCRADLHLSNRRSNSRNTSSNTLLRRNRPEFYLIAFTDHSIQAATAYKVDGDQLYWQDRENKEHHAPLSRIDVPFSQQINRDRNVDFQIP